MKNINFNVSQDIIEKLSDDVIISDSFNYVQLTFNFDSTWSQYNVKKATFFSDYENGEQQYEADIVNNVCVVPYKILQKSKFKSDFMVGVYGQAIQDSTLQQRNTTNMVVFSLRQGAYFVNALNPGKIDPSAYDLYLAQLQQIFQNGLNEYNSNAQTQINNFNSNANEKIQQLNGISANVEQIEQNIEKIQENVQQSEANAQTSAENAKTSEQNAQKSAENASKILTNVTGIQTNINETKGQIDTIKEGVDAKAGQVNTAVEEATNQANISKQQAELSIKNANQTSANKIDIENMKNDVASIKTSVEQTKSDIEQIKTDTQTIYDDTLKAKEETLKAKTEVENSVGNERISNDKKYAKAIDTDEIEIIDSGEVELDEDSYMKDVEISTINNITQKIRKGYNLVDFTNPSSISTNTTYKFESGVAFVTSESGLYRSVSWDITDLLKAHAGEILQFSAVALNFEKGIKPCVQLKIYTDSETLYSQLVLSDGNKKKYNIPSDVSNIQKVSFDIYCNNSDQNVSASIAIAGPMLFLGTESKAYEEYGISPSVPYPSNFENIEYSACIDNHQLNYLDSQIKSQTINGLKIDVNEDKSFYAKGTPTVRTEPHVWDKKDDNQLILRKGVTYWNLSGRTLFFNVKKNIYLTIDNQKSYTPTEDTEIEYAVYFRFEKNETVDEIIYPFLTTEKDGKYEPFNGYLKKIELENQFLGSFNNYKNYIKSNKLYKSLKTIEFDGTENWTMAYGSGMFGLEDNSINFKVADRQAMSNCFSFRNIDLNLYNSLKNYEFALQYSNNIKKIFFKCNDFSSVEDWKAKLKELYTVGNPLKVLYVTTDIIEEDISELNLNVFNGINNIDTNKLKLNFKANRNLPNYIDDKIKSNSSEEIKKYDSRYSKALKLQINDVKKNKIYVENSQVEELKIEGEEITQNKRFGYNLLVNKLTSKTIKGVTFAVQDDGSIVANGTPTATIVINLLTGNEGISDVANENEILEIPESINNMVLSGCPENKQSKAFKLDLWSKTGELIGNDSDFGSGIKIDFSTNANWRKINRARIVIYAFAKLDNTVFRPMLTEGTEQKPYEKYGATPSFEFPAEIETKYPNIKIYNEEESVHVNVNAEIYGIKNFKDEIVKNKLIKYIKKLELTGTEEILKSSRDNLFYMQLDGNIVSTPNVNMKSGLVLSNCFKNESYTDLRNYSKDYGIEVYLNRIYFRILDFNTAEEVKNKLKELYDSNNSVKIYYILSDPETFELTEEQKQQLDKFKLFDGANNILIENGKLSFKYNKSIQKVLEEKDDKINDLQNQIDEIKALLNTTSTSALLLTNLETDLESEVK